MKNIFLVITILLSLLLTSCGKESAESLEMITSHIIVGELEWRDVVSTESNDPQIIQAKRVGKLDIPMIGSRCTAFLISEDVVMTNQHCIPSASYASEAKVQFKFEKGVAASSQEEFVCDEFIGNDKVLDYALLKCKGKPGKKLGFVKLESNSISQLESLYIIQQNCDYYMERNCQPFKKIAFGRMLAIDDEITHDVDTLGGSSGSPVFSVDSNRVIAIHHAGYGNNGLGRGVENYAVPMSKIVADISVKFPGLIASTSVTQPTIPSKRPHTSIEDAQKIELSDVVSSELSSSEKQHFYSLKINSSRSVKINISFTHRMGDLDLQILSTEGKVIASSTSTANSEEIIKSLSSGSYIIKVYGYKGAIGKYKLVTF